MKGWKNTTVKVSNSRCYGLLNLKQFSVATVAFSNLRECSAGFSPSFPALVTGVKLSRQHPGLTKTLTSERIKTKKKNLALTFLQRQG